MPRPKRFQYPGAMYHVTAHSIGERLLFIDDFDRVMFLAIFEDVVRSVGWVVHAYCLMGTHYHLVIMTPEKTLARGMQALNGRYGQSFNRKHGTVGHVFRRRYDDVLIQSEAHLFECIRYVALNPVRGGLCRRPEDWEWGSYQSVALAHRRSSYFDPAIVLKYFGRPANAARSRFTAFVNAGLAVPRAA